MYTNRCHNQSAEFLIYHKSIKVLLYLVCVSVYVWCACVCVCVNQAYHTKLPSVDILYLSTFIDIFLLLLVYYPCTYNFNGYVAL